MHNIAYIILTPVTPVNSLCICPCVMFISLFPAEEERGVARPVNNINTNCMA